MTMSTILVTGGAGFIGSALVRYLISETENTVVNVDKLTYAGHLESLQPIEDSERYHFEKADICDTERIKEIFKTYQPDKIIHLAAESHVDRSIDGSAEFVRTNIVGTHILLDIARSYYENLKGKKKGRFRFLYVSIDEVYGELGREGYFKEATPYNPHSPYSASKASSDYLARAWHDTYGLPLLITNFSNNYDPYQFPEKLIPVYGDGKNVRDWLYVNDHARALYQVATEGRPGETYNISGHNEKQNVEVVKTICSILDEIKLEGEGNYSDQITFVTDRPGHDWRYAIDSSKIENELGWKPNETFETGIKKTVQWYLDNIDWCEAVTENNYGLERLGVKV